MITADQLLCHAIGDYILQSDWMANEKTKQHFAAFCHALVYSLAFLAFRPSPAAWLVIFGTHFLIDRYRLARYIVWAKNWLAPKCWWWKCGVEWKQTADLPQDPIPLPFSGIIGRQSWHQPTPPFSECAGTGYPPDRPAWLAVWLLIIADNILHVAINGLALKFL